MKKDNFKYFKTLHKFLILNKLLIKNNCYLKIRK